MQQILNFLIKHNHWFLFILLEGISFVLLFSFNRYQNAAMFTSANEFAGNIYSFMSDVDGYFGLSDENEALVEQNRVLINEIEQLKQELASFKDSTALATNSFAAPLKGDFRFNTARAVNNSLNKVNNFITIDKGNNDGINSEMGVFNDKGVIGIIYKTSDNFSLVMPLLNSKSMLSCRVKGSNSFCTLRWNGEELQYSYLIDLPRYAIFQQGDTVVTSGFSSIFPADIPVGEIERLEDSDDGMFYRARVRLFVDFASIDNLFVVGNDNKLEQDTLEMSINKIK
ncbi:MAG: rod shape-determining protein MreC [Bacteroidaceae bacterium]|nr:rod shape-determining protein MreC [Bacteroidaceae bacterium]